MTPSPWRGRLRIVLALFMVAIGVAHFAVPGPFVSIVPAWLPAPTALVLVSGLFEVLGGLGLLVPRARRLAGVGLVVLYVAVFPANVNMAMHPELGQGIPGWALWGRLPMQLLFVSWALWAAEVIGRPRTGRPLDELA
jgi:uncharacterized membrane protein